MKLKALILAFIVFSILSLDLNAIFTRQVTLAQINTELFTIEHFKYNIGSIVKFLGGEEYERKYERIVR